MNLYAFIASIIGSLSWPVLIAWLVVFLIKRGASFEVMIETVRKYVKSVKLGSVELTLQDARKDAEAVAAEQGKHLTEQVQLDEELMRLATVNPPLAVLEIWKQLETEIIRLQQHSGSMRWTSTTSFMKLLRDRAKISRNDFLLYSRLKEIRNEVVHSRDQQPITIAELVEYQTFVATLIERFERLKSEPGFIDLPDESH